MRERLQLIWTKAHNDRGARRYNSRFETSRARGASPVPPTSFYIDVRTIAYTYIRTYTETYACG